MKKKPLLLIVAGVFMIIVIIFISNGPVNSSPFQLIESESAVLNNKGSWETKVNYAYEFGHIPVHLALFRFRLGVVSRFEIGVNINGAYFPDQKDIRVSEVGATIKAHILKRSFKDFNMFFYLHYRHSFWGSFWRPVIKEISTGFSGTLKIVSPHADGGMDTSGGFLFRHSFKLGKKRLYYLIGLSYSRLEGRYYGDFKDLHKNRVTVYLSPEIHFYKDLIMFAIENRVSYWIGRGYYYKVVPQIRFEPIPYLVFEIGASIPVVGAGNYRIIAGINHEFNKDY